MKTLEFHYTEADSQSIVIYGATVGGKLIFQCLQSMGIRVAFFVDRDKEKKLMCGIPVKDPSVLQGRAEEYKVIIALTRSFLSACQYMNEIGYDEIFNCVNLINDKTIDDFIFTENDKVLVSDFLKKYPIYADDALNREIILPALEVFITERCTLRCRDCSHLIPRYTKPIDYDIEDITGYLDNVLKLVGRISDLIILGGEPLLHKEIGKLLEFCYREEKIDDITIISNATVMPDENVFWTMSKVKARLRLSNYGKYSIRLEQIKKKCEEQDVICFVNDELWTDMGAIYNHEYTKKELREIFTDCPFAYDLLLLNGYIFRCAHVAHLNNLNVINSYEHDCVNIADINEENVVLKKKELEEYLHIPYLEGCSYCNGIKNSIQGIEPAIQGAR